jgi:hypothetical protein
MHSFCTLLQLFNPLTHSCRYGAAGGAASDGAVRSAAEAARVWAFASALPAQVDVDYAGARHSELTPYYSCATQAWTLCKCFTPL